MESYLIRTCIYTLLACLVFTIGTSHAQMQKGQIQITETLEVEVPKGKTKKGVVLHGKIGTGIKRGLHFFDKNGKEIWFVDLGSTRQERPYKVTSSAKIVDQVNRSAKICTSGNYVGILEEIQSRVEPEEGAEGGGEWIILYSSNIFRYYDNVGNFLWERNNVRPEFFISEDGTRVGLVEYVPLSPQEMTEHLEINKHSWGVIYDFKGNQVFKYDPGENQNVQFIGLSKNGEYGIADKTCFWVETGRTHTPDYKGPGVVDIDDNGNCRVLRYIPEHDELGKQKTKMMYEYKF